MDRPGWRLIWLLATVVVVVAGWRLLAALPPHFRRAPWPGLLAVMAFFALLIGLDLWLALLDAARSFGQGVLDVFDHRRPTARLTPLAANGAGVLVDDDATPIDWWRFRELEACGGYWMAHWDGGTITLSADDGDHRRLARTIATCLEARRQGLRLPDEPDPLDTTPDTALSLTRLTDNADRGLSPLSPPEATETGRMG